MLAAGYTGLILAAEPKLQTIMKYRPMVIWLNALVNGRKPTEAQRYDRLMMFIDALGEGKYREHNGKAIDFIATDGFLEIGRVIYGYWNQRIPISKSTGEKNTFALWDNVAERSIEFFQACRDAAGSASTQFGFPPVGFVTTCGEKREQTKFGEIAYIPLFPGRKAPEMLPYMFEQVIRLSQRTVDKQYQFVAHTIGNEEFTAKCPPGVFDAEVLNPDFGEMYGALIDYYRAEGDTNGRESSD